MLKTLKELFNRSPSLDTDKKELEELKIKFKFLYYWTLRQDEHIKHIIAKIDGLEQEGQHNNDAFDYKWLQLHEGEYSLSNPKHKEEVIDLILRYTNLDKSWFKGKRILDAGCGDGRFSYALCKMGAQVVSCDISETGVEHTRNACIDFPDHNAYVWNLLKPLPENKQFDLILSFGVLHHTGDTARAIRNLAATLKPDGLLAAMVYGYPRLDVMGDFKHMVYKEELRQAIKSMNFDEAHNFLATKLPESSIRGWFDAITPLIEDHYTFEQISRILRQAGFKDIKRHCPEMRNIIVTARSMVNE